MFGATKITFTTESGTFSCPACEAIQRYRHKIVRRFVTIYLIPIIPLDITADYVECASCGGSFNANVLLRSPGEARAEFLGRVKRAMVLAMIADGSADEREIDAIRELYQRYAGRALTREEIANEARWAGDSGTSLVEYLRNIEPQLGRQGKELIAKSVFLVASATGGLRDAQLAQLKTLPAALRISEEEFRQYIDEALEGGY